MTTPNQPAPEQAFTIGTAYGSDLTEESADAIIRQQAEDEYNGATGNFRDGIMDGFGDIPSVLTGVADAFMGNGAPATGPLRNIYDTSESLRDRTDLLESVVAYGNQVMGLNQWVVSEQFMPFDQQVGPRKGVNVVAKAGPGSNMGYGFQLQSAGLWRVDTYTLVSDTPFTGQNWADLEILVLRPDHTIYEVKRFTEYIGGNVGNDTTSGDSSIGTIGGCHSFVAPTSGYMVFVRGRAGRWRRYMGGTLYSQFSINKWDNGVTAQAPGTVGDSEAPT